MSSNNIVTEEKLTEFYEDIKPYLGCPAYVTQEGDAEYYSTDEKVIGRWIDGKPLYQKTLIYTNITTGENTVVHGISNLERVTSWTGSARRIGDGYTFSIPTVFITNVPVWSIAISGINATNVNLSVGSNFSGTYALSDVSVTIQYTKSTDSVSTTIEQKPTHYSTDEQVIGTWVDGKPVYQKTLIATGTMSSGAELGTIDNLKRIIKLDGGFLDSNNSHGIFPWVYTNQFADVFVDSSNNKVTIVFNQTVKDPIVTVQYTKTTD